MWNLYNYADQSAVTECCDKILVMVLYIVMDLNYPLCFNYKQGLKPVQGTKTEQKHLKHKNSGNHLVNTFFYDVPQSFRDPQKKRFSPVHISITHWDSLCNVADWINYQSISDVYFVRHCYFISCLIHCFEKSIISKWWMSRSCWSQTLGSLNGSQSHVYF